MHGTLGRAVFLGWRGHYGGFEEKSREDKAGTLLGAGLKRLGFIVQ